MITGLIFESLFLNLSKLSNPRMITTGSPSSACPIIRDAAEANSSQVAISVVSSSLPYKSFSPTLLQIGEIPEQPIAVPTAPNLKALP